MFDPRRPKEMNPMEAEWDRVFIYSLLALVHKTSYPFVDA